MNNNNLQQYNSSNQNLAQPIEIRLTDAPGAAPAANGKKKGSAKPPKKPSSGRGYAIASFCMGIIALIAIVVLGIFSLVTFLPYGIGLVASIMGIVFGATARKKGDTSGLGTAGLVMSIIAPAVVAAVILLFVVGCGGCMALMNSIPA